jgi:aminopeptidase-like protein
MEKEIESYFDRLWPICRSITGNGLRESFKILQELIPLNLSEVATGTQCFDWEVPREWNIKEAYIVTPEGKKICDFKLNNLHVVNYSSPQNREIEFKELNEHLHTIREKPTAIPYVTSYYNENWGFCISYEEYKKLSTEGTYRVIIDSSLKDGSLTYGDLVLPGSTHREILFSTYLCHPSMANNELSGPLALAFLYGKIKDLPNRKFTYRFVVAPETIGVVAYLSKYGFHLKEKVDAGYVLTCLGTKAPLIYKMSKRGDTLADRAAIHVLKNSGLNFSVIPFAVGGSDERQYCSPGFDMPVGSVIRSKYQDYPEYHTSLDNKSLMSFVDLKRSIESCYEIIRVLEMNAAYSRTQPYCELQLGKRGLYSNFGGTGVTNQAAIHNLLHFLAYADGKTDLIELAEKRNCFALDFSEIVRVCIEKNFVQ